MTRGRLFYIIIAVSLLVPILMTVMLTMMDGQESVDQQTGQTVIMQGPDSVWESFGTLPSGGTEGMSPNIEVKQENADGAEMGGGMDVMALCNINMAFMGVAVFVCLFISDDFRSGFSKNLFTVRAGKGSYVISKTVVGFAVGAAMLIAYFIGAMLGGAICSLSFALPEGVTVISIIFCMLAKILLMAVFVSIFVLISVSARSRAWLGICGSLGGGMLLFMMVSMITPLNAGAIHVLLCLAGGAMFAVGLGAASRLVLNKVSLV